MADPSFRPAASASRAAINGQISAQTPCSNSGDADGTAIESWAIAWTLFGSMSFNAFDRRLSCARYLAVQALLLLFWENRG